jgi:hypothetical protein
MAARHARHWQFFVLELGAAIGLCVLASKLLPHAGVPHSVAIFLAGAAAARLLPYTVTRKSKPRRSRGQNRRPAPRKR